MAVMLTEVQDRWRVQPDAQVLKALESCADTPEVRLFEAEVLLTLGFLQAALDRLSVLEAQHHAKVVLLRGQAHWQLGDYLAAQACVKQLYHWTHKPPLMAQLMLDRVILQAELLLANGQAKDAVLQLAQALRMTEQQGQEFSGYLLAVLAEAQGIWSKGGLSKARETAQKALDRSPEMGLSRIRAVVSMARLDATYDTSPEAAWLASMGWSYWAKCLANATVLSKPRDLFLISSLDI